MSAFEDRSAELASATPWTLAHLAGVSDPDALDSAGAEWLRSVASVALDIPSGDYGDADDLRDVSDLIAEQADSLVPIYTHQRMRVLVDLAAYLEDIEELASGSGEVDLVSLAGIALYQVAERLLSAILGELADARDADAEQDDTDEEGDR